MKRIELTFFLLLSGLSTFAFGQSVRGKVTHLGEAVSGVHVINRSSKRATISDEGGRFLITAGLGDTLLFSSVQLKQRTITVTRELLANPYLQLELEEGVLQLDEVVLRPYDLSGDLQQDLRGFGKERVISNASLGLPNLFAKIPTQSERKLYEATSGSGLIPLNPILNGISGRTKMLKKRVARDRTYERTKNLRRQLGDSLLVKDLLIPINRIADFLYYCEVDTTFQEHLQEGDPLVLLDYLKDRSRIYRELNEIK